MSNSQTTEAVPDMFTQFSELFEAFEKKVIPKHTEFHKHRRYENNAFPVPIRLTYLPSVHDWYRHFLGECELLMTHKGDKYHSGSIAIVPVSKTGECKFLSIDGDNEIAGDMIRNKLIPFLEKQGIPYIYESSHSLRGKIWIFKKCTHEQMHAFYLWLMSESGCSNWKKEGAAFEFFPGTRPNNPIRFFGGVNLKTFEVYKIKYNGVWILDPIGFVKAAIDCGTIPDEYMQQAFLKFGDFDNKPKTPKSEYASINYQDLELPIPNTELRPDSKVKKVLSSCKAFNWLYKESVTAGLLNNRTEETHRKGLFLMSLFFAFANTPEKEAAAHEFAVWFLYTYRDRDSESHKWVESAMDSKRIPYCETMEKEFDQCEGCPFRNMHNFVSPRQLANGTTLETVAIKRMQKATHEYTREEIFPKINAKVKDLVDDGTRCLVTGDFLLGSGKSTNADNLVAEILKEDPSRRIIISCLTGQIAKEHEQRLREQGIEDIQILSSHKNYFRYFNDEFECPSPHKIEQMTKMGLSKSAIVDKVCDKCPFVEKCKYPDMYKRLKEVKSGVVICQHAHLTIDYIKDALSNDFDPHLVIIDEDLFSSMVRTLEIPQEEIELIEHLAEKSSRLKPLRDWMKGRYIPDRINLNEEQRKALHNIYESNGLTWQLPNYQTYMTNGQMPNEKGLLFLFTPIKFSCPTMLFDATMDKNLVKMLFEGTKIIEFANETVLDIEEINKDTRITQVIDGSTSKSFFKKDDNSKLDTYLTWIGNNILENHPDDRVLITAYKEHLDYVVNFMRKNFAALDNIDYNLMSVGTNLYEEHVAQYLISGVYLNSRDYHREAYKLYKVEEYWKTLAGQKMPANPYRWDAKPLDGVSITSEDFTFYQYDREDKEVYLTKAVGFSYIIPKMYYMKIAWRRALAKTLQAIRIRFNGSPRHLYIFDNRPLKGLPITDIKMVSDIHFETASM